jgi:hypothetical protein
MMQICRYAKNEKGKRKVQENAMANKPVNRKR